MIAKHALTIAVALTSVLSAGPVLAQPAKETPQAQPPAATKPKPGPPSRAAMMEAFRIDEMKMVRLAEEASMLADKAGLLGDARLMTEQTLMIAGFKDAARFGGDFGGFADFAGFGASFDNQQSAEEREKAREMAEKNRERDRENRLYEEAYRMVNEGRYERAVERWNDLATMKGDRADDALYWKAYSQDRLGQRAEALATIAALSRDYPKSAYVQQARVLEAEVRRNSGQPARPLDQADDDMKLMALQAVMQSSPEQAVPVIQKVLAGTASPKVKERALFVLAQSDSPQAREVLKGVAKGSSTPELQSRAISYLGTQGGRESRAVLAEVYTSSTDVDIKKRILRAFMTGGEKDRLFTAAQSEQNPELRAEAVRQLGVMGAHNELSQLYAKETSVDIKKQIIRAMFVGGNSTRMIELAKSEQNPDLRREAIRNLGLMGARGSADALVEIYGSTKDVAVRKSVIQALSTGDNAAALVAIARKEEDITLKKEIVQRLSHMNSKIATDYMLELLNK